MRFIAAAVAVFVSSIAFAGDATLDWENAPGIAGSQIAIGSCNGAAYGQDVSGGYATVSAAETRATFLRLEQGEMFCFRIRHFYKVTVETIVYMIPGDWLFLGSKRIPPDSQQQDPPIMPQPPKPVGGSVK